MLYIIGVFSNKFMVLKIPVVLIHKVIWLIFVAAYINRWPKSIWCLIPENFHNQGSDVREVSKISKSEGVSKGNTF